MSDSEERSRKRRKTTNEEDIDRSINQKSLPHTLTRSISPPPLRRNRGHDPPNAQVPQVIKSPFQLTWIRDLPESSNIDAVSLKDILGDPMIAECWEFNYLHDLNFLMDQFDSDVKDLIKVHVVHGFWKNEDHRRIKLKVGDATGRILPHFSFTVSLSSYGFDFVGSRACQLMAENRSKRRNTQTLLFTLPTCQRCSVLIIQRSNHLSSLVEVILTNSDRCSF